MDLWRGHSHENDTIISSGPASAAASGKYFPMYSVFIFNDFLQKEIAALNVSKPTFIYAA